MRQKNLAIIIGALAFSICLLGLCQAAVLLDTGPGPSSGQAWSLSSIHRGIAGKFTSSQTFKITNVEAWMQIDAEGPAKAVIYNDDGLGDIPGTIKFSQTFTATVNPNAAWRGASGLNWSLPAGTYWVGFEVDSPGIEGVVYCPAPHPLGAYAANIFGTGWFSVTGLEMGFRIQGISQVTPSLNGIDLLLLD